MIKKFQSTLSLGLLAAALAAGIYYLVAHHKLLHQLTQISPLVSLSVLALYIVMFTVLMLILGASIKICHKSLGNRDNAKLNAHSLFINNFLLLGQGGVAYRGIYLNRRHKLRVKNYLIVTLLYYVFYAMVSIFLLLGSSLPWWQTALALLITASLGFFGINEYSRRVSVKKNLLDFNPLNISYLLAATVLQALVQIAIYAVELHSVNAHISFSQILTYTGAANLALFVALTPASIGIRESFLIFTERLHHISSINIVGANVIDRSVYLIFLLILLAISVAFHIKGRLELKKLPGLVKQTLSE